MQAVRTQLAPSTIDVERTGLQVSIFGTLVPSISQRIQGRINHPIYISHIPHTCYLTESLTNLIQIASV